MKFLLQRPRSLRSLQKRKKRRQTIFKKKRKRAILWIKKREELSEQKEEQVEDQRGQRKNKQHIKQGIRWGILVGVCIGIIYTLLYSPIFTIQHIVIEAKEHHQEIQKKVYEQLEIKKHPLLPSKNIALLQTQKIQNAIQEQNEVIENITVQRKWPNSILVIVKEREAEVLWNSNGTVYEVGETGIVLRNHENHQTQELPTLYDTRDNTRIQIGDRIASEQYIHTLSTIQEAIQQYTPLTLTKLSTPGPETREIHIETNEGWKLLIDATHNIKETMNTLNKIVEEELTKEDLKSIEYIDLRISGKTFYKFK